MRVCQGVLWASLNWTYLMPAEPKTQIQFQAHLLGEVHISEKGIFDIVCKNFMFDNLFNEAVHTAYYKALTDVIGWLLNTEVGRM